MPRSFLLFLSLQSCHPAILLFCLLVFLSSCPLAAQSKFKAGLLAGFTATQYDGDSHAGYNKLGLLGGVFSRIPINERWKFQFAITYFQKGARKYPNPEKGDFSQYELNLDYAEVPVLFLVKYKKIVIEGGLAIGFLVAEKEVVNEIDITGLRPFGATDFSFNLGLTYRINDSWEINSRYNYSILPVRPHPSGSVHRWNRGEYNNCLSFELRYIFGQKEKVQ